MTVLITGASSGIGEVFARRFAAGGRDLALVARDAQRLERIAQELRTRHGVAVAVLPLDLATPDAAARLAELTERAGLEIDVLVNNAGFASHGDVAESDPGRLEEQIRLNCATLAGTTARYLPGMRRRGGGAIVNIASTAAFQPVPHMAVYAATKAFVLSFTEALWAETRRDGVRVLAVCPGATDTAFFQVAGEAAAVGRKRSARGVVDRTMRALRGDAPSVVDGLGNALAARLLGRLLPRRAVLAIAERSVRP